jgi:hypothetical protein
MTRAELMRHAHLHRQQTKTPGHCAGVFLDRTLIDCAAISFGFLRQPSRLNPTRPVAKSGRAAAKGTGSSGGSL